MEFACQRLILPLRRTLRGRACRHSAVRGDGAVRVSDGAATTKTWIVPTWKRMNYDSHLLTTDFRRRVFVCTLQRFG